MEIEIDLTSVLGSILTLFWVGDEDWLDFSVKTEIDLFFVRGQNCPRFFVPVEYYLFLMWAWKMIWFLWWSKITWSQCGGSNLTWFQCRDDIELAIVWVVELDLLLVCWPKITCFEHEHENLLGFCVDGLNWLDFRVGDRTWLDSSVGWNTFGWVGYRKCLNFGVVDRQLFGFGQRSKMTCF